MIIVGLDWARGKHDYLLMAPTGEILQWGRIPHNTTGLQELAERIDQHAGSDRDVRVGIEMNDGALLAWLMEKGHTVFGIQAKSSQRAREVYRWIRKQGKHFGCCGATDKDEANRFQAGMMMISTGGKFFHAWHLTGGHTAGQVAYDRKTKKLLRAPAMINWADGMNDLKAYFLLKAAIEQGRKNRKKAAAVKAAEKYLAGVFKVFNGDHRYTWTLQPVLGTAWSWGCEGFYDHWQEQMLKHAAAIRGAKWID